MNREGGRLRPGELPDRIPDGSCRRKRKTLSGRKEIYMTGKGINKPLPDAGALHNAFGYETGD